MVATAASVVSGCVAAPPGGESAPRTPAHHNAHAVLWMQNAAEYRASALQTYALATAALPRALAADAPSADLAQRDARGKPPAIVMDLDETVLDNSPFFAEDIRTGAESFDSANWELWTQQVSAGPVPGAIEFIRAAQAGGARVFFVSNRQCAARVADTSPCPQLEETVRNLRGLGVSSATLSDDVLLLDARPEWGNEKSSRRAHIAARFRIAMLVGDDLGDFAEGVKGQSATMSSRQHVVDQNAQRWGTVWFVLANPMYGSWEQVLPRNRTDALRGFR